MRLHLAIATSAFLLQFQGRFLWTTESKGPFSIVVLHCLVSFLLPALAFRRTGRGRPRSGMAQVLYVRLLPFFLSVYDYTRSILKGVTVGCLILH